MGHVTVEDLFKESPGTDDEQNVAHPQEEENDEDVQGVPQKRKQPEGEIDSAELEKIVKEDEDSEKEEQPDEKDLTE